MNIDKYAAVDIGSNAIRLLIASITEPPGREPIFKKISLVRVPIRLGADVFVNGKISEENYLRMQDAMKAFSLLMKTHNIVSFRACATSAMREASNGMEIAEKIRKKTGIHISIIDGEEEAGIIASTDLRYLIQDNKVFLYVDVGGGSTEFTIFASGHTITSRSFKLGTVRLINNMVDDSMWEDVKQWIQRNTEQYDSISVIGSGGNINSIYKASGIKIGKPLSYFYLTAYYKKIQRLSYEERIVELNMNPDRADVVMPATRIYLSAMKWSKAKDIHVPKIGLSDGIIKSLYNEKLAEKLEIRL